MDNFSVIAAVLSISLRIVFGHPGIGQPCTIKKTNEPGVCKLVQDCPDFIRRLNLGPAFNLEICGYQGTLAIVCCVSPNAPATTTPTTPAPVKMETTTTTTTTTTTARPTTRQTEKPQENNSSLTSENATLTRRFWRVGDKSETKCKEYEKYVFSYPTLGAVPLDECKVNASIPLITGGEKAMAKEFPHMALVGYTNKERVTLWLCGGSLISDRFILTAGHCLKHPTYGEAQHVRLGELVLDTDSDDADPQDFKVAQIFKHPGYYSSSRYNDIGLLKLNKKARLNTYVRPACLDTRPVLNMAYKPIATGWGKIETYKDQSKALLKVTLEYFTQQECNTTYSSNIGISLKSGITYDSQICAGSHKEAKDACEGDSGGPLQVLSKEHYCMYNVVGITSFGKICGVANVPGVYTRVYNYIEWIENIVWP